MQSQRNNSISFFLQHIVDNGTKLELWGEKFNMVHLIEFLNEHPEIKTLTISSGFLTIDNQSCLNDQDIIILTNYLKDNKSISKLNLPGNKIRVEGVNTLISMLEINKTIASIDISNNEFGDDGIKAFAQMIQSNSTLTSIDISGNGWDIYKNRLGSQQLKLLADALEFNNSLTTLKVRCGHWRGIDENEYSGKIDEELRDNVIYKNLFPQKFVEQVIPICQGARQPQSFFYSLPKDILFEILKLSSFRIRSLDSVIMMCSLIFDNVAPENRKDGKIEWKKDSNGIPIFQTKQTLFTSPFSVMVKKGKTFLHMLEKSEWDPEANIINKKLRKI